MVVASDVLSAYRAGEEDHGGSQSNRARRGRFGLAVFATLIGSTCSVLSAIIFFST